MARIQKSNIVLETNEKIIQGNKVILDGRAESELSTLSFDTTGSSTINKISNDGTLENNSDTAVPTEQAVKTYVDTNAGSAAEKIIYYDSWVQTDYTYPTTNSIQTNINERFASYIVHNFSNYGNNCKWEMVNIDTGEVINDLTFSTVSDITYYKNNNVSNNGSSFLENVSFRPYDIVDENIPVIDKMYGVNRLYAALRGRKNYKSGQPHCGNMSDTFYKGSEILYRMFSDQFPDYAGNLDDSDFLTGTAKQLIWLSSNSKKMYGIPKNNSFIKFDNGNDRRGRYIANENWEGPTPLNTTPAQNFHLSDARILGWTGYLSGNGSVSSRGIYVSGKSGISRIDNEDISVIGDIVGNSLDGNIATYDNISDIGGSWIWSAGTLKCNKVNIIFSCGNVTSGELRFYYIPSGKTSSSDAVYFDSYTWSGGGIVEESIDIELPYNYQWCDGIYIDGNNYVGGSDTRIHIFKSYTYVKGKTIMSYRDKLGVINEYLQYNSSSVVFYKAINKSQTVGDRDFAVFVKPIGIDILNINYIDFTKYDLEAVYVNRLKQKSIFRNISSDIKRYNPGADEITIYSPSWKPRDTITSYWNGGSYVLPDVYFRLRDKTTKKVGNLSRSKVSAVYDHKGSIPLKWLVI